MKLSFATLSCFLSIAVSLAHVEPTKAALIGNGVDGNLYNVNTTTGLATNPRSSGITTLVDVAYGADGTLYGLTTYGSNVPNSLIRINPITGASTIIGATGLSNIFEGDLAFQPGTGVLFGAYDISGSDSRLFTINTLTGVATPVGNISGVWGDLSGMAFAPNGTFYIIAEGQNALLTVDPATAAILNTVVLPINLGAAVGFDFDPATGVPYVADGATFGTNNLYTLNVNTGALALVGPTGLSSGLAGLSFTPIPEPATVTLIAAMAFGLLGKRRRIRTA